MQQDNTEEQLVSIASSIKADPYSWKDWLVLRLEIKSETADIYPQIVKEIEEYLSASLKNKDCSVHFSQENVFYVFGKDIKKDSLLQIGVYLKNLICRKRYGFLKYNLYVLPDGSYDIAEDIFSDRAGKFSIDMSLSTISAAEVSGDYNLQDSSKKLLLVEDDPTIHCLINNALQDAYEITHVSKAHDLFSIYEACNPNIVFLDIGLPNADGKDLLEWIMHNDPAACVIMLSAQGNSNNISECIENGAKGFISKPFTKDDMFYYLNKYA